jgi:hypothetical protein
MAYTYDDPIIEFDRDWGEIGNEATGKQVQDFIKDTFNKKVGYFYNVEDTPNNKSYLLGFKDREVYEDWYSMFGDNQLSGIDNEMVISKTPIEKAIPEPYKVIDLQNLHTSNKYISLDGNITIPVKYVYTDNKYDVSSGAIMITPIDDEGDLTVEAKQSGEWAQAYKTTIKINSNEDTQISLTEFLKSTGNWQVRMKVSTSKGEESSWITYNIIKTTVDVKLNTGWENPQNKKLELSFNCVGEHVKKTLKIEITGVGGNLNAGSKITYSSEVKGNTTTMTFTKTGSGYDISKHGIHNVKYWVIVEDDENLKTPVKSTNFMVIGDPSNTKPYIIINNLADPMVNWSQQTLLEYAIYIPGGNSDTEYPINFQFKNPDGDVLLERVINSKLNEKYSINEQLAFDGDIDEIHIHCDYNGENLLVGENYKYVPFKNDGEFSPTPNAKFILNPRLRSNNEENPEKIYNTARIVDENGNVIDKQEVKADWSSMEFNNTCGWIKDENNYNCLRILSGQQLKLTGFQPFLLDSQNNKFITIETTFMLRNIVDPTKPIFHIGKNNGENLNGFELCGETGYFLFDKPRTQENILNNDIVFGENQRVHLALCVNYGEKIAGEVVKGEIPETNDFDNGFYTKTLEKDANFIRIYINGVLNRIVAFTDEDFKLDSNNLARYITIGNTDPSCDIDIYEIRVYQEQTMKHHYDVLRDYCSSLPTINEKQDLVNRNTLSNDETNSDSFKGGIIDYNVVIDKYNTLLLEPSEDLENNHPFVRPCGAEFGDKDKKSNTYNIGDLVINLIGDTNKSGRLKNITFEGQGTTAMSYFKWNQRGKLNEIDGYNSTFLSNAGETLDGCYRLNDNDPIIKRLDGKINWASSMQTHKMGSVGLYNDLWKGVVKNNGITSLSSIDAFKVVDLAKTGSQAQTAEQAFEVACKFTGNSNGYGSCRVSVRQEPFMFFVKPRNDQPEKFYSFLTWGASKGDKPTFGYNSKFTPNFVMIEGADNDGSMVRCKVPWDNTHCTQLFDDGAVEGTIIYTGDSFKQYEISMGDDSKEMIGEHWDGQNPCLKMFRDMINFIYLHRIDIEHWTGTYETLKTQSFESKELNKLYWVDGDSTNNGTNSLLYGEPGKVAKKYDLFRYNTGDETPGWVPAGLWVEPTENTPGYYKTLNLKTQLNTNLSGLNTEDYNEEFKKDRGEYFKNGYKNSKNHPYGFDTEYPNGIEDFLDLNDLLFHQQFLKLLAGTDNWGKNTYIYNSGIYYNQVNGVYSGGSAKYEGLDKFRFFQDDLDTIFNIDNYGKKTKPYWIEEGDYDENNKPYWNASDSGFYGLVKYAYGEELKSTMNDILANMSALGGSPEQCFANYYQNKTHNHFPEIVYNVAAEKTYIDGYYRGTGRASRNDLALAQCLGDQKLGEQDWQTKRSIYLSSYAKYGTFAEGTSGKGISFAPVPGMELKVKPYMWLYPSMSLGSNYIPYTGTDGNRFNDYGRVEPDHVATFALSENIQGETSVILKGDEYYKDLGNLAGVKPFSTSFTLSNDRLTNILIDGDKTKTGIIFDVNDSFNIHCKNLDKIEIKGKVNGNKKIFNLNSIDLTNLIKLTNVDLSSTNIKYVRLPKNSNIDTLILPGATTTLELDSLNKLYPYNNLTGKGFKLNGYNNLESLVIKNMDNNISTYDIFTQCKAIDAPLNTLSLTNINWDNITSEELNYLINIPNLTLTGKITMAEDVDIDFDTKMRMLDKFDNIDDPNNQLYIKYNIKEVNESVISIKGYSYIRDTGIYQFSMNYPADSGEGQANDFIDIEWRIDNDIFGNINAKTGVFNYNNKQQNITDEELRVVNILCKIKYMFYDGIREVNVSKPIYLYEKLAEIGDLVYADGTYSNGNDYMGDKTIVGICVLVDDSKDVKTQKRVAMAISPMYNESGRKKVHWGLDKTYEISGFSPNTSLKDITSTGTSSGYQAKMNEISGAMQSPDNSKAENTSIHNVGWTIDGLSYGEYYTQTIINLRNNILRSKSWSIPEEAIPVITNNLTELQYLDEQTSNSTLIQKGLAYYPAFSYCYAYEPVINDGEILNDKFKKHKWFLPSQGELLRMLYYTYMKRIPGTETKLEGFEYFDPKLKVYNSYLVHSSSECANDYCGTVQFVFGNNPSASTSVFLGSGTGYQLSGDIDDVYSSTQGGKKYDLNTPKSIIPCVRF